MAPVTLFVGIGPARDVSEGLLRMKIEDIAPLLHTATHNCISNTRCRKDSKQYLPQMRGPKSTLRLRTTASNFPNTKGNNEAAIDCAKSMDE